MINSRIDVEKSRVDWIAEKFTEKTQIKPLFSRKSSKRSAEMIKRRMDNRTEKYACGE